MGVDPGSWTTGWGMVGGSVRQPLLMDYGRIRLAGDDFPLRLAQLRQAFGVLVQEQQPTTSAVESPFHGVNARAALQLAHARGVILAVLAEAGVEIVEYTPAVVKKSVTGNGRATKEQVELMVGRLLDGRSPRGSRDATDALAVALCHATASRYRSAVARALVRTTGPADR